MKKSRIVLLGICILFIGLIFLLPKVVIENENQMTPSDSVNTLVPSASEHTNVSADLSNTIKNIKSQYVLNASNQKNAIFADSLHSLYTQAGQFDSAAWYAEQAATFFNTQDSYLKAGNSYYEAYTFALQPPKQKAMAEKSQEWLGKVLETNPHHLEVKTKIAMTYMGLSNPMKGVKLMREVLTEDPKNELALYNMGVLSIQSGQYDKAIDLLNELILVNKNHIQGQLLLGLSYLKSGNKAKAQNQFEKVKKLNPDPAVQAEADSYLKELK